MTTTDPIADMLTRIRNAMGAKHDFVLIPASKIKIAIAKILREEEFILDYEVLRDSPQRTIKVHLRYAAKKQPVLAGLQRVSKPGLRVYVQKGEIPRVYGGLGVAILSTPQGVMTGQQAWRRRVGGEVLCYVW
ncbi:MAG: 30S ribosomal protein S8 [Chloroflexi bacterium RBG_13_54_9]|nr:MAG: 30S ribosomal protein S8 [Chloroflexi bacterium RBG_13_54_9]